MVDPVTAVAITGAAAAGKLVGSSPGQGLLSRLFGPTCDEWGQQIAAWATRRHDSATNIIEIAGELVTEEDGDQPNMRVAAEVLNQGSWSESEVSQAYLGGLLAGSRSTDGENDSNLPFAALINVLSTDEILLHYVVYRTIASEIGESDRTDSGEVQHENNFWGHKVTIPFAFWFQLVETPLSQDGMLDALGRLNMAIGGLRRQGLLHTYYRASEEVDAYVLSPTHAGAYMFLRGHGHAGNIKDLPGFDLSMNPALDRTLADRFSGTSDSQPTFSLRSGATNVGSSG